jgi:hypothetical protein
MWSFPNKNAKRAEPKRNHHRHQRQDGAELGRSTEQQASLERYASIPLKGTKSAFRIGPGVEYPVTLRSNGQSGPLLRTSFSYQACRFGKGYEPNGRENANYRYFQYPFLKNHRFQMHHLVHTFILLPS